MTTDADLAGFVGAIAELNRRAQILGIGSLSLGLSPTDKSSLLCRLTSVYGLRAASPGESVSTDQIAGVQIRTIA